MKIPGIHMDKNLKQNFLGGVAGGVIFHLEQASYELVRGYPTQLADHIDGLPRNGQLLASAGPLAAAWVAPKIIKKHSAAVNNIKMGITLYDFPKLVQIIGVNMAYNMGRSNQTPPQMRNGTLRIIPQENMSIARMPPSVPMSGTGKYTL